MKGKTFEYAKQMHVVKSYTLDEECFTVNTDKNTFKRKVDSADEFFKYWLESPQNMAIEKAKTHQSGTDEQSSTPTVIEKENNLADELVNILRDNIRKVQKDPAYIKQATSVTNNVNSILNVQKLKIQYIREHKRRKREGEE